MVLFLTQLMGVLMRQSTPHREVSHFYLALVDELRRHIRRRGWSLAECCDRSGLNDGHVQHLLTPLSKTGRVGRYDTIDTLIEALAGRGYSVVILPADRKPRRRRRMPDPMQRELPLLLPAANGNTQLRLDLRAA